MINKLQNLSPEIQNLGLTISIAVLRGLLNHENIWTVIIDSILCGVFSLAILHTDYFHHIFVNSHDTGIFMSMVIGGVGSKYILKAVQNIFDLFINRFNIKK